MARIYALEFGSKLIKMEFIKIVEGFSSFSSLRLDEYGPLVRCIVNLKSASICDVEG